MSAAIVPLFHHATAAEARSVCSTYRINYLVANLYDPVWQDRNSWAWTLPEVLINREFRALECK